MSKENYEHWKKFEKDCDNIFNRETYAYAADDYVSLYCILTDVLYELIENQLTPDFLLPTNASGLFGFQTIKTPPTENLFISETKTKNIRIPTISGVIVQEFPVKKLDEGKLQGLPASVTDRLRKDIETAHDPHVERQLGASLGEQFDRMHALTGDIPNVPRPEQATVKTYFGDSANRAKFISENIREIREEEFSNTNMANRLGAYIKIENEKIGKEYKATQRDILKIGGFVTIRYFYGAMKLLVRSLPKKILRIWTSKSRQSGLIDEFLTLLAGLLLGKEYIQMIPLAEADSKTNLLDAYLAGSIQDPDPYINQLVTEKFLIDQIPEKFKKEKETNLFLTEDQWRKLEREKIYTITEFKQNVVKKEVDGHRNKPDQRPGPKFRGGALRSQETPLPEDEDEIEFGDSEEPKREMLKIIDQHSKELETIAKIEAIPSEINTNLVPKVAGLYVNEATAKMGLDLIPVEVSVFEDRTFSLLLRTPPAASLILKAIGVEKGSGKNLVSKAGTITKKQIEEIAAKKLPDLNAHDLEAAARIIAGTARSMGVDVK